MEEKKQPKQRVLIADDSEMNCMLLEEMLGDEFDVISVENGRKAVDILSDSASDISLLLLDLNMPEMDGFEVLAYMNKYNLIEEISVIIISAETAPEAIQRAYDFGVTDFISRPFDAAIVRRRVENTLLLAARQRRLTSLVTEQIYEKEKSSRLMIAILSHIVEFRNGESGMHVVNINTITELLLRHLQKKDGNPYELDQEIISRIAMASALHDIGKLSVPDEVLNKPGKLTDEEFAIMKQHSMVGAQMLDALPKVQREDPLTQTAYEICRWHHERYDGRGYPDGLKGEEIPLSAQIVSIADVYDALTSERCYKKAFSHETAIEMILDGQCGIFNPVLLEALQAIADSLPDILKANATGTRELADAESIAQQFRSHELSNAERMVRQLDFERRRFAFFAANAPESLFTYTVAPPMLTYNGANISKMGIEAVVDPMNNREFLDSMDPDGWAEFLAKLHAATPASSDFEVDIKIRGAAGIKNYHHLCRVLWAPGSEDQPVGCVGRILPAGED